MKHVLLASSLLALGAMATGCASTAKGVKTSAVNKSVPTESLKADVPEGGVLAVIRYPAIVEANAKDAYHRAYAKQALGGATGRGVTNTIETVAIADSIVVKSNYFALSLYKEMAARLPEHAVLLSPHSIKLGPGGELTSEPLTGAEDLPNVVSVDFATYSFPDSKKMMSNVPLTFGDLFVTRAAAEGRENALETIEAMQRGDLAPVTPELDFISYITNDTPQKVSTQKLATRSDKNSTLVLPVEKVRIPESEMELLAGASDGTVDPIDDIYTEALSQRIVALINGLDTDKAIMMGKAASVAEFDPSLAQRKYLSVQSLRIFDGIHNGELGAQVRDMISAEQKILEQRRELAREQNAATLLAVAGFVGGAVTAAGGSNCRESRTQQEFNNCVRRQRSRQAGAVGISQAARLAALEARAKARLSQQLGTNFLNAITPVLEQQTTVTVDLLDSNETITAIRYEDLQAKLQSLYTERQRSLETVATQCAYVGEDGTKRGTWLGVCEGGLANGSGAGVLKSGDDVLEYYGYAKNGLADGPGLMIRHSALGSISYEGSFSQGLPNGTVRVSESGRADENRNFVAGVDAGESSQKAVSPFDGFSGGAVN